MPAVTSSSKTFIRDSRTSQYQVVPGNDLAEAIYSLGFTPPAQIHPGKWHRFAVNGKARDDAGSCRLFDDGRGGFIQNFRTSEQFLWLAESEEWADQKRRAERLREFEAARRDRERQDASKHAKAAGTATWILKSATPARADHPYLVRKQVSPDGLCEIESTALAAHLGYAPQARGQALTGRILLAPVTNAAGVTSLELIDESGRKSALAGGKKAGAWWAHGLPDGDGTDCTIVVAEGIATAKTAWNLTGWVPVAALTCGNLRAVAKAMRARYGAARLVVVADAGNGQDKATEAARAAGADLVVPVIPVGCTGSDINDVAVVDREEARRQLLGAGSPVEHSEPPPGPRPLSRAPDPRAPTVSEVRALTATAINSFGDAALGFWDAVAKFDTDAPTIDDQLDFNLPASRPVAPQVGIDPVTGIGKSTIIRNSLIPKLRQKFPKQPVVVPTPTIELAATSAEAAIQSGLRAVVIRGRDAPRASGWTPLSATDRGLMCIDPDAPADAMHAVEGVQNTVCTRRINGEVHNCPHFAICPYQLQRSEAKDVDVIYLAHQHLFTEKPEFITTPSALVIDESFWQAGLVEVPKKIACDLLCRERPITNKAGVKDVADTQFLQMANSNLSNAIKACIGGPLTVTALRYAGITSHMAASAGRLWWLTKIASGITPGIDAVSRKKRRGVVEHNNKTVSKYARAWKIVSDLLTSGKACTAWLQCGVLKTEDGEVPGAAMKFRREIAKGWTNIPTLLLDATLQTELARWYFPNLQVTTMPYPATPHARVVQILGAPVSANKLGKSDKKSEKNNKTAHNHQLDIARYIEIKASQHQRVLVVSQMDIEIGLRAIGLPENVEIAHFNATRGLDHWGPQPGKPGVDYALIIGRTLPQPNAVESLAECISGVPVAPLGRWFLKADGGSEYHHDPVAEACRWGVCEAELVQTIGRARSVNRQGDNPVVVEVMNDVALPVPVDATVGWVAPGHVEVMAARGVVPSDWPGRALVLADLLDSDDPAHVLRQAAMRDPAAWKTVECVTFSYKRIYLIGESDTFATFQYRTAGNRKGGTVMVSSRHSDPRAAVERWLGPLDRFMPVSDVAAQPAVPTPQTAPPMAIIGTVAITGPSATISVTATVTVPPEPPANGNTDPVPFDAPTIAPTLPARRASENPFAWRCRAMEVLDAAGVDWVSAAKMVATVPDLEDSNEAHALDSA